MKTCTNCHRTKPYSEFGIHEAQKDGLRGRCKECEHVFDKAWRDKNPEKVKNKQTRQNGIRRERRQNDPVYRKEVLAQERLRHSLLTPEQRERKKRTDKAGGIRQKYGLSFAQYRGLIESQGGKCAICGRFLKRPHVDHDHKTGKIRGILCCRCNVSLAGLGDSISGLEQALEYLKKSDNS